jgi:hypothetical protein
MEDVTVTMTALGHILKTRGMSPRLSAVTRTCPRQNSTIQKSATEMARCDWRCVFPLRHWGGGGGGGGARSLERDEGNLLIASTEKQACQHKAIQQGLRHVKIQLPLHSLFDIYNKKGFMNKREWKGAGDRCTRSG